MNEIEQKALELKGHLDALTEKANNAVNKEQFSTEIENLKTLVSEIKGSNTSDLENITEQINQLKESLVKPTTKKFDLRAVLEEKAEELKAMKTNPSRSVDMELKVATTMLISTHTEGDVVREDKATEITDVLRFKPTIWDDLPKVMTNAPIFHWVEKVTKDGTAAVTAEGEIKPLRDFELVARKAEAVKIPVVEKASKEMLEDIDGMRNFIYRDMTENVSDVMKTEVTVGDGTGDHLTGIYTIATAFNAFGKTVQNPNIFDVLRLAILQVTLAGGRPTSIALNPVDLSDLELTKDTTGQYILPPFSTESGTRIKGVRVLEDVNIPVGKFMVYDRTKVEVRIRENINVTSGYENDDFRRNLVMFIAEARLFVVVKENHKPAFVKGDIADAIEAITPVAPEEVGG